MPLLVEDFAGVLEAGQIKKSVFLAALRASASQAANEIVFGAGWSESERESEDE